MPIPDDLVTLNKLWALKKPPEGIPDDEMGRRYVNYRFDMIGLILHDKLLNGGYHCTPVNCTMFADTGMDGCHFSMVHIDSKPSEHSPIVMTQPLSNVENVIVGANMHDFLCFGCEIGFATMYELAHNPHNFFEGEAVNVRKPFLKHFFKVEPTSNDSDASFLEYLRDNLELKPWENARRHLMELQDKYFSRLVLPEGYKPLPGGQLRW